MPLPNKYYATEEVLESLNTGESIHSVKTILRWGGIDEIIKWALMRVLAFEHDLDKSIMTFFGGESDVYFFLKIKVSEIQTENLEEKEEMDESVNILLQALDKPNDESGKK